MKNNNFLKKAMQKGERDGIKMSLRFKNYLKFKR